MTPGSRAVGATRISMSAGTAVADGQGALAPTAARIPRHCFTRRKTIAANPQAHTVKRSGAIHCGCATAVTIVVGSNHSSANGALKSRAAGDATNDLIGAGACGHWTRLPSAASAANGTRNFTEAPNQSQ